jgi:hypothetical protein
LVAYLDELAGKIDLQIGIWTLNHHAAGRMIFVSSSLSRTSVLAVHQLPEKTRITQRNCSQT